MLVIVKLPGKRIHSKVVERPYDIAQLKEQLFELCGKLGDMDALTQPLQSWLDSLLRNDLK